MPRDGKAEGGSRRADAGKGKGKSGGGGGRRGGRNDDRETVVSKKLSYILRHGAKGLGLQMDERGFVGVGELVSLPVYFYLFSLAVGVVLLDLLAESAYWEWFPGLRFGEAGWWFALGIG